MGSIDDYIGDYGNNGEEVLRLRGIRRKARCNVGDVGILSVSWSMGCEVTKALTTPRTSHVAIQPQVWRTRDGRSPLAWLRRPANGFFLDRGIL